MTTGNNTRPDAWPQERMELLRKLWEQSPSLSASQIGQELGVTRNSVIGKAHRMGLPPKRQSGVGGRKAEKKRSWVGRKRVRNVDRPKLPPTPEVPNVVAPLNGEGITLMELERGVCHTVISSSFSRYNLPRYCGQPSLEGESYCHGHYHAFHNFPPIVRANWRR